MQITPQKIRKWVFSGAMHPIALIREPLAKRIREKYSEIWDDLDPYQYPWPAKAATLRDAVSTTCQDQFRVIHGTKFYYKLLDLVWLTIFNEKRYKQEHDRTVSRVRSAIEGSPA